MSIKVLISAGEVSGDQHLARVVHALREVAPNSEVRGMAGRDCRDAGATIDVDCYRAGAGMGFFELFRSGGKILSSFRTMSSLIRDWKPDLLVLVDYPDFNLRLAKVAKHAGVKVLYFIPPKVWAWRSSRVKTIRKYVDHIAAIFPFEQEFYARRGFSQVTYVGHPLGDLSVAVPQGKQESARVLLLPGSRRFEVERLLVPMLHAFELLKSKHANMKPVVLLAPNIDPGWVKTVIGNSVGRQVLEAIEWSHQEPLSEMVKARVAVLKSGTCNLEGALAGLPFVCVYSGTLLAKIIVSLFVSLKEYSPVNIIKAGTVKELIQVRLSPRDVVRELEPILEDGPKRAQMIQSLSDVSSALTVAKSSKKTSSVAGRVAQCIVSLVSGDLGNGDPLVTGVGNV